MNRPREAGASLIEVLVAILILSFGMLSLGALMAFATQAPKLSGYRAIAANLANSHIERIRANPGGFAANAYTLALSYDGTQNAIALANCAYTDPCDENTLAAMDNAASKRAARMELPFGGMMVNCSDLAGAVVACTKDTYGNLWMVWQDPSTYAALQPLSSDNCPAAVTGVYTNPRPRCLYVRFKIE